MAVTASSTPPMAYGVTSTRVGSTSSSSPLSLGQHFVSKLWIGAASGMVGITAVYPLDTIKTRLQFNRSQNTNKVTIPTNALQVFRSIWHQEGVRAFYKGLGPQLCGTGPDKAISLATRDFIKRIQKEPEKTSSIASCAAIAGAVQSTVMNPVELVKVRMQLNSSLTITNLLQSMKLRTLYRGYSACFLRDVTFSTLYFTMYETLKQQGGVQSDSSIVYFFGAGITAGIPAAFLTTPLDVIKTRLQGQRDTKGMVVGSEGLPPSFHRTVVDLWKLEGPRGFFKGWGPRVARIAPQFGIVLVTYEWLSNTFG